MSYIAREDSVESGEPIELYEFTFPHKIYRYSTGITPYVFQGQNWLPVPILRDSIKADNRKGAAPLSLTVPKDFEPSLDFKDYNKARIPIKVYRTHVGELGVDVFFTGQWFMADVNFTHENSIIRGGSIAGLLGTELPRFFWQFQCNHELYSTECGVDEVFLTGTVTAIDSTDTRNITVDIVVPAAAQLGVITVGTESRLVRTADGLSGNIVLLESFEFVSIGDAFSMHDRGCDRSYPVCVSRFANGNNFGGMPFIPKRNVFDGGF